MISSHRQAHAYENALIQKVKSTSSARVLAISSCFTNSCALSTMIGSNVFAELLFIARAQGLRRCACSTGSRSSSKGDALPGGCLFIQAWRSYQYRDQNMIEVYIPLPLGRPEAPSTSGIALASQIDSSFGPVVGFKLVRSHSIKSATLTNSNNVAVDTMQICVE